MARWWVSRRRQQAARAADGQARRAAWRIGGRPAGGAEGRVAPPGGGQAGAAAADPEAAQRAAFLAAVDAARREWLAARAYFDCVTDPDLIDYAIFTIEAAEKKYMYLLKRARERGYKIDFHDEAGPSSEPKLARL